MTNGSKRRMMLVIVVLLAANFAKTGYIMNQYAERIIKPPPVETVATVASPEIVTGVCTFGDCPVATTACTTETTVYELEKVEEKIEEAVEPVSETYTLSAEPVTEEKPATESHESSYIGRMYVTAYTAEEGFPEGSATASGYGVRSGYCALNNSQRKSLGIKYGDKIYVDGLGTYTVMDCGCDWGVVDIWVYSNAEAYLLTGYYDVYLI